MAEMMIPGQISHQKCDLSAVFVYQTTSSPDQSKKISNDQELIQSDPISFIYFRSYFPLTSWELKNNAKFYTQMIYRNSTESQTIQFLRFRGKQSLFVWDFMAQLTLLRSWWTIQLTYSHCSWAGNMDVEIVWPGFGSNSQPLIFGQMCCRLQLYI